jgi:hypothetical protein
MLYGSYKYLPLGIKKRNSLLPCVRSVMVICTTHNYDQHSTGNKNEIVSLKEIQNFFFVIDPS